MIKLCCSVLSHVIEDISYYKPISNSSTYVVATLLNATSGFPFHFTLEFVHPSLKLNEKLGGSATELLFAPVPASSSSL